MSSKSGKIFTEAFAPFNEAMSSLRSTFTVFAAGITAATEQAQAAQHARVHAAKIGLANGKAEEIIYDHLHRAQESAHAIDWDAVRRDMTEAAL